MSIDRLLLETGDFLLLETSDKLLLESSSSGTATTPGQSSFAGNEWRPSAFTEQSFL